MAESDLYPPVKRFLEAQGYAVKGEVRECDVVAVRGDEAPVIVELKTGFSLQLLLQGVDRQAMTDAVYLAFGPPKRRQRSDILKLCKRLGLGVLVVTGDFVEPLADPEPYQPRRNARRTTMLLKEFAHRVGDPNTGGTTRRPRMTAYRQDALRMAGFIGANGPAKVAVLRIETGVSRAAGILQNDVYGWFMRESRGIYTLSPKGIGALTTYQDVVSGLGVARS
ncbi:MAG: hypothetical protein CFE31_09080 [Rhizobiales bacterium PAR1]|nr:MAG: hypothetical protein CFE31_09080 [Rhizobiales bacterium PAR1]